MATPPRIRERTRRNVFLERRPERAELRADPAEIDQVRSAANNALDRVIDRSITTGAPLAPRPSDLDTSGIDSSEEAIGQRLTSLSGDPAFQREYRMRLLHRMLMRQLSMDLIARTMQISVRQVYNLREKLFEQLREEATNKDLPTYVGLTDGFYNDIIGTAMRMASNRNAPDKTKLHALQVALQAQRDRTHFYEVIGFHDVMKVSPASGMADRATEQADTLIDMTKSILNVFTDEETPEAAEVSARDLFARRRTRGGEEEQEVRVRVL